MLRLSPDIILPPPLHYTWLDTNKVWGIQTFFLGLKIEVEKSFENYLFQQREIYFHSHSHWCGQWTCLSLVHHKINIEIEGMHLKTSVGIWQSHFISVDFNNLKCNNYILYLFLFSKNLFLITFWRKFTYQKLQKSPAFPILFAPLPPPMIISYLTIAHWSKSGNWLYYFICIIFYKNIHVWHIRIFFIKKNWLFTTDHSERGSLHNFITKII